MHPKRMNTDNNDNEQEILRKLSPSLFAKKQEVDQAPPEGYFEALPDRVMDRIRSEQKPAKATGHRRYINVRNVAIAAAIALLLALIPFLNSLNDAAVLAPSTERAAQQTTPAPTGADIETSTAFAAYIDEEDLYAVMTPGEVEAEIVLPDNYEEAIMDYLLDEDVPNQMIAESLNTEDS